MAWADFHIEKLKNGETVQFRPKGNSMTPRIKSGELVTVRPLAEGEELKHNDIVLCTVSGNQYLHLVKAVQENRVQIGNNKGHINGWTNISKIYGICIAVED